MLFQLFLNINVLIVLGNDNNSGRFQIYTYDNVTWWTQAVEVHVFICIKYSKVCDITLCDLSTASLCPIISRCIFHIAQAGLTEYKHVSLL